MLKDSVDIEKIFPSEIGDLGSQAKLPRFSLPPFQRDNYRQVERCSLNSLSGAKNKTKSETGKLHVLPEDAFGDHRANRIFNSAYLFTVPPRM
jgi:hypothetical protein